MATTQTDTLAVEQDLSSDEQQALFDRISEERNQRRTGGEPAHQETAPEPAKAVTAPAAAPAPQAATAPAQSATAPPATPPPVVEKKLDEMTQEELRAHAVKLEHERVSAVGRAAKYQREDEARRRQPVTPAQVRVTVPETARLNTAFPELSSAVLAEIDDRLGATQAALQQQIVQDRLDSLSSTFGDNWPETMQSNEFHNWLSKQPATEQQKYHSDRVGDYASLLRGYEKATAVAPPTTETAGDREAARIAASRQQRLDSNAAAPRGRPTVGGNTTGEPDADSDPQALFNYVVAKRDAKLRAERQR